MSGATFALDLHVAQQFVPEDVPTPPRRHATMISKLRQILNKLSKCAGGSTGPSTMSSLLTIARYSWLNILLVCVPISWAMHFAHLGDALIFAFSFFAIVPLANLYSLATDELSKRVGQGTAGLINATLGNVVELIVAIVALKHCELRVVQASLVGSMLSNLLLVLGMSFIAGGYYYQEQGFSVIATQTNSTLLIINAFAFAFIGVFNFSSGGTLNSIGDEGVILQISRGVAVILLFTYIAYLVFEKKTHSHLFVDGGDNQSPSTRYPNRPLGIEPIIKLHHPGQPSTSTTQTAVQEEEDDEAPLLSLSVIVVLLAVVTALVAITSEFLVDSISGITSSGKISKEFIGLILLPIVGNAAEHASAVTVAMKDKLSLSLAVAAGSSIQIGFFVYPLVVIISWGMGRPLTFLVDVVEIVALLFAVLVINYVVQDGKSQWLEGLLLMNVYVMIATVFWFYPGNGLELGCN